MLKNSDAFNSGILTAKVRQLGAQEPSWVLLGSILGSLGAPFQSATRELFLGLVPGRVPRWILGAFSLVFGGDFVWIWGVFWEFF